MTYAQAILEGTAALQIAGVPDFDLDAGFLLEFCCGLTRTRRLMVMQEQIPQDQLEKYREYIEKRAQRIPLQHLTGEQEFYGRPFMVNENVLVPRQDTETLAEAAIKWLKGRPEDKRRVLDLCTGSGCLATTIALEVKGSVVSASDLSEKALEVAGANVVKNGAAVKLIRSDLFADIEDTFDLIISNPPYIPTRDIQDLEAEVKDHDPMMALDGGADGLDFYRLIAEQSPRYLSEDGALFVEIGNEQGKDTEALFAENGFTGVKTLKDLGGNDRVVQGELTHV